MPILTVLSCLAMIGLTYYCVSEPSRYSWFTYRRARKEKNLIIAGIAQCNYESDLGLYNMEIDRWHKKYRDRIRPSDFWNEYVSMTLKLHKKKEEVRKVYRQLQLN